MRSRVGSKGRITLPQRVREVLRVKPGDEVEFVIRGGQVFLRPRQEVPLENLFGRLKVKVAYPGEAAEREARAQAWVQGLRGHPSS